MNMEIAKGALALHRTHLQVPTIQIRRLVPGCLFDLPSATTKALEMKRQYFLPLLTYPNTNSSFLIANAIDVSRNRGATLHSCALEVVLLQDTSLSSPVEADGIVMAAKIYSREHAELLTGSVKKLALLGNCEVIADNLCMAEPLVVDTVAEMARCYDLTLMESAAVSRAAVEAVLFSSGSPLLLFPPKQIRGRFDHIAVAWDGTRAASRALADADDFLGRAAKVTILTVANEQTTKRGRDPNLIKILERKGLSVDHLNLQADGSPIAGVLQERAIEIGADLLVAGGFGHSRLREFVLGGVTRSLLSDLEMPVLMSH